MILTIIHSFASLVKKKNWRDESHLLFCSSLIQPVNMYANGTWCNLIRPFIDIHKDITYYTSSWL